MHVRKSKTVLKEKYSEKAVSEEPIYIHTNDMMSDDQLHILEQNQVHSTVNKTYHPERLGYFVSPKQQIRTL